MSSWKQQEDNNGVAHISSSSSKHTNQILQQLLFPITLKFVDVQYSVKLTSAKPKWRLGSKGTTTRANTRTILSGITGMVRPGEVLAMLGPSGSGKTTLLTALAGRLSGNISGTVSYNDNPFSATIKRKIGFVPQDDLLFPHLTVVETLTYAAMLRLPKTLTKQEKLEQVEMVINELGLSSCRNIRIGSPLLRGVSGGERKRASIGHEMIMNPSVVMLDEPTSGLDSTTSERIVGTLRQLARSGRTLVTTIHQPSTRLFMMFDKVIVMASEGSPIYSGDAGRVMEYFESIGYAPALNFINPAEFLLDLATGITPETKQDDEQELLQDHQTTIKQSLILFYKTKLYPSLKSEIQTKHMKSQSHSPPFMSVEDQWTCSWWEQFVVLLKRGILERKHEPYFALRISNSMFVSVLLGLVWWQSTVSNIQDQIGFLFFISIAPSLFAVPTAIFVFQKERAILVKERSSGMYCLSSYFLAQIIGNMPMELFIAAMFVTVPYWMSGLKASAPTFILTLLIILLNVLASQGLGLAIGAGLKDAKQATTLASMMTSTFLLLGGYYAAHLPVFIDWSKYISYTYYTFKLLLGVQYTENETYDCQGGLHCKVLDYPTFKLVGVDRKWLSVVVMILMSFGYRVIAYVALRAG